MQGENSIREARWLLGYEAAVLVSVVSLATLPAMLIR